MTYIRRRKEAFRYAVSGLFASVREESHMQIHLVAATVAVSAGIYLEIGAMDWLAVAGSIALVMICEIFNTAVEKICDLITLSEDARIKYIKDISSGAVLLSCVLALIVAAVVFGPKVFS